MLITGITSVSSLVIFKLLSDFAIALLKLTMPPKFPKVMGLLTSNAPPVYLTTLILLPRCAVMEPLPVILSPYNLISAPLTLIVGKVATSFSVLVSTGVLFCKKPSAFIWLIKLLRSLSSALYCSLSAGYSVIAAVTSCHLA